MKQLIPIIFGIMFMGSIAAQDYSKVKYNIETPFTGFFTEKRFLGERIDIKSYIHKEEVANGGGYIKYEHSKDGLRDTLFSFWGLISVSERIYSANDRLVALKRLDLDTEENKFVDSGYGMKYTYDSKGRIASIVSMAFEDVLSSICYNYDDHTIKHYMGDDEAEVERSVQIEYTDSGYICWDTTYQSITVEGETTLHQKSRKDEYIFDSDNRLIWKISEFDNSKHKYRYIYTDYGYMVYLNNDVGRSDFYFNEKGKNTKVLDYWFNGKEWQLKERTDYFYIYDDPQSNAPVLEDVLQPVYGVENGLVVGTDVKGLVNIYTISGQLIKQVNASLGDQIPLTKGFYIVSVGDRSYKVRVR